MAIITAGITALLGGTALGIFFATPIGAAILSTVVGLGLSLAASALAGIFTPDQIAEKHPFAVQGKLQAAGNVSRSMLLGRSATAGSLIYHNTWGEIGKTPNAFYTQVIQLADWPVDDLVDVWINGKKVDVDWNTGTLYGSPVEQFNQNGSDFLWVKFYNGDQTTADNFLVTKVSSAERPYGNTRVGRGCPYVILTARLNESLFTGFPQARFVVDGARLYDPTRDTTAGGSGSQRWDDPDTWGGDGDRLPAVQLYNILRGLYYDGDDWFYGLQGVTEAQLPNAHWRAQIAKCRANIAGPGGTDVTFRSGGEIRIGTEIGKTVDALLTACQGRLSEAGGVYKVFVGAPGSSVLSISDSDIISTEGQTFSPFFGLADTITGISGTYPNPDEMWNAKTAPALKRADLEEGAGDRQLMADVAFDLVPYRAQVQRLMKMALLEASRARRHTITLPPSCWALEPGDVIEWTSVRNGYEDKLFRIDGVADQANLDIVVDITEINPNDYDWDQDTDFYPEVDGPLDLLPPTPQAIVDFDAEPCIIEGDNGTRRPGIRLIWDGSDQDDVDRLKWEIRRASDLHVVNRNSTRGVSAGEIEISTNLFSDTDYEVQAIFDADSKREFEPSEWLPVTTPNVKFNDLDVILDNFQDDVRDLLQDALSIRPEVRLLAEELASQIATGNGKQVENVAAVSKSQKGLAASLLKLDAFAGPDGSQAEALLAVQADYDDLSAQGLLHFEADSSPLDGATAQLNMLVSATEGGTTAEAGMYALVRVSGPTVTSDLVFHASRIFFTNNTDLFKPFVIVGGALYGDQLKVRTAMIDNLAVTQGKIALLAVDTAQIANAAITQAKIANLAVGTAQIDNAAVTNAKIDTLNGNKIIANTITADEMNASAVTTEGSDTASGSLGSWVNNTYTTVASFTLNSKNGHAFKLFYDATISGIISGDSGGGTHSIAIRITVGGTEIKANTATRTGNGSLSLSVDRALIEPRTAGNHVVAIQMRSTTSFSISGSWTAQVFGECNKV